MPVGADWVSGKGTHFRVWAPAKASVDVVVQNAEGRHAPYPLRQERSVYFSGLVSGVAPGDLYSFRLDAGPDLYPDPASRFQPQGPHGPSQVIDPNAFHWTDFGWKGCRLLGQVIYEMHIGTFTPEGTWRAAITQLPELARLGVSVLEIMPVADFPGDFGWGYDGVDMFAPTRLYGHPDDFRAFVDAAHALELAVILDVVYNHLGPDGNYLKAFSPDYFTDRYETEWGEPINFDGELSAPVREFFLSNARYWIEEFHIDGLRLDATQAIFDSSPDHIIKAIARTVREAARGRDTIIIAENEPQRTVFARPVGSGGYGLDGLWNDDFHHSAVVAMTGHNEAYYTDHTGSPQEFISSAKYGYLFQGQWYSWQNQNRGTPSFGLPPSAFVNFIENHDQIANSGRGMRVHQLTSPGRYRSMVALMLLGPGTPMLFQGQEFQSSSPFFYFAHHKPELAELVSEGRKDFLRQFPSLATPEMRDRLPEPADRWTFVRSKLDPREREVNGGACALHRDLIQIRREDLAFSVGEYGKIDGAVIAPEAFLLRFFGEEHGDRLLLVNFGRDLHLKSIPDPLTAPPLGRSWRL
ncbi:MAG: malto-oligosyltrehalose trehalohydrolase [SAR202 cluster bacterium]|nr:malto-oligosyltrehalose trehalohydrolase [SAR202 cluster bacterium]